MAPAWHLVLIKQTYRIFVLFLGEGGSERTSNGSLADVYIHVTDVNDNAPVFKKDLTYEFNDFKLKDLMNITATDPDTGAGGEVKFRFLSSKRVSNITFSYSAKNLHRVIIFLYSFILGALELLSLLRTLENSVNC